MLSLFSTIFIGLLTVLIVWIVYKARQGKEKPTPIISRSSDTTISSGTSSSSSAKKRSGKSAKSLTTSVSIKPSDTESSSSES